MGKRGDRAENNVHRRRRRLIRWLAAITTVVLVLVTVFLWLTADEARLPDADLLPAALERVDDVDNAYWHLRRADARIVQPAAFSIQDLGLWATTPTPTSRPAQLAPTWSDVETCLRLNQEALAELERGIACEHYRPPEVHFSTDPVLPRVVDFQTALFLLRLRARWHLHHGRTDAALDDAVMELRFGCHVIGAPEKLIEWLAGRTLASQALHDLQSVAAADGVDPAQLRAILVEVFTPDRRPSNLARALRCGYRNNREIALDLEYADITDALGGGSRFLPESLGYKPNRTLNKAVRFYRAAIAHIDEEHWPGPFQSPLQDSPSTLRLILSRNAVGESVFAITVPALSKFFDLQWRFRSDWARTHLALAMRIYELEHGQLPEQPQALLPDILPALPVDPITGEPPPFEPDSQPDGE